MHAVGQVEISYAADTLENERHQRRVVSLGDGDEYGLELFAIALAHIWRHLHTGNHDLRVGILRLDPIDDRLKIFLNSIGGKAAQSVVGAQLEKQNVNATAQKPINSIETAGRGVTALAGIDDLEWPTFGIDFLLDQGRIGLADVETVTGCDTVAEKQNDSRRRGGPDQNDPCEQRS